MKKQTVAKLSNEQINSIVESVRGYWGTMKVCGATTEETDRIFNVTIMFAEEVKRLRALVKGRG